MHYLAQLMVLFLSSQALECWGLWEFMAVSYISFTFSDGKLAVG